jgi:hypothetical protein
MLTILQTKLVLGTMFQHLSLPCKRASPFSALDPFEIYWVNTNTHELNLISLDARADGYCIGAP